MSDPTKPADHETERAQQMRELLANLPPHAKLSTKPGTTGIVGYPRPMTTEQRLRESQPRTP